MLTSLDADAAQRLDELTRELLDGYAAVEVPTPIRRVILAALFGWRT